MFLPTRPSSQAIERFLRDSQDLPLSYDQVGLARGSPVDYDLDESSAIIGRGEAAFERAKAALSAWKHFDFSWVEVSPPAASIAPGSVVAVLVRHLGFWSLSGCRVLYTLGDRALGPTFGFAYGTLVNHVEQGEEIFEVSLRPGTLEVVYRIRAASRPRAVLARAGYPIARFLQARFRRDSGQAMRDAVEGSSL
jgi:uncharacterized protein (UPF0548 family)